MKNWKQNITFFIAGQMISFVGSLLVQYAIFWYINLQTQSGTILTIAIVASFIPMLVFSPIAGVWADKLDRKLLIIVADGSIAFVTLMTAILFSIGTVEIWMLIVVTFIRGIGQAIHGPAIGAAIPMMVPKENLMRVQGIQGGIQSAFNVLSPILAALLITNFSIGAIYYVDFVTAIIGVLTLLVFVTIPKHGRETEAKTTSGFADFKAGLGYVKTHRFLIPFFIYLAIVLILVSPTAFLTPLQVVRSFTTFHNEYVRLTALEIAFSLGMTLGAGVIALWGGFNNRILTAGLAISVMGLGVMMLGVVSNFYLYIAFMLLQGIALPFYNTPTTVVIQEQVEPQYMGRVMSILSMISASAMPVGIMIFGPLADLIAIEYILFGSGIGMMIIGVLYFVNQPLMHAGKKPKPSSVNVATR
jgi:DHA3 family macrolide efflux protein-like MFS transporter